MEHKTEIQSDIRIGKALDVDKCKHAASWLADDQSAQWSHVNAINAACVLSMFRLSIKPTYTENFLKIEILFRHNISP